ncbi:MAG: hypothetical protein M3P49_13355 [Actinomycetota bacterium]|nr:hypothetical protein [Actinomycetota bacterium]
MNEHDATYIAHSPLLASQFCLLEDRRADVAGLSETGTEHDATLVEPWPTTSLAHGSSYVPPSRPHPSQASPERRGRN